MVCIGFLSRRTHRDRLALPSLPSLPLPASACRVAAASSCWLCFAKCSWFCSIGQSVGRLGRLVCPTAGGTWSRQKEIRLGTVCVQFCNSSCPSEGTEILWAVALHIIDNPDTRFDSQHCQRFTHCLLHVACYLLLRQGCCQAEQNAWSPARMFARPLRW